MQKHFETELEELKKNIIAMASLVDEMVGEAFVALRECDIQLSKQVITKDKEVDALDVMIQEKCEGILALFTPVAKDLRYLITAIMINNQLERCGDIAVNIAQRVKKIAARKDILGESSLLVMGEQTRDMVKEAIDAFINEDINLASQIGAQDVIVDAHNKKMFQYCVEKMKSDPEMIEISAHLLILSRHIERLADHATNIAEQVIFMINAEVVTHKFKFKKKIAPSDSETE